MSILARKHGRGAALILFATILILGVAWYAVSALGRAPVGDAERDVRTGLALQGAKQALLGYVAQYAARTDHDKPGRLPCPEALASIGTANEGQAAVSCSDTTAEIGRLPWQTLGIDRLVDGAGEPLWYVIGPGFRGVATPINFGTPGQLSFNDTANAAVAVIIAPGRPLNTLGDPAALPGWCPAKVNQSVAARNTAPLAVANFLECGNASGGYRDPGTSQWTNDRAIAISAAEWADAIAGPVADRLQRQVAPALADWRANESNNNWSVRFLPAASTFSNPATNSLCGSYGVREGLMPVARAASSTCTDWTGGSVNPISGSLGSVSCGQAGGSYQCQFTNLAASLLVARIQARSPNVGQGFRGPIVAGNIAASHGGTVSSFSLSLNAGDGDAHIDFRVSIPTALGVGTVVTVTIPNLPDASILSDTRMAWFVTNDWARHTYYAIAPGSQLNASSECLAAGDPACMDLNGLPASSDKRFVIALMGRSLAAQSRSCATDANADTIMDCNERSQYIESRTSSMSYHQDRITSAFNDRLAACPFKYVDHGGANVAICN